MYTPTIRADAAPMSSEQPPRLGGPLCRGSRGERDIRSGLVREAIVAVTRI